MKPNVNIEQPWHGWIAAQSESERSFLEEMGVTVGKWNAKDSVFEDCSLPYSVFAVLETYWGRFFWRLVDPRGSSK